MPAAWHPQHGVVKHWAYAGGFVFVFVSRLEALAWGFVAAVCVAAPAAFVALAHHFEPWLVASNLATLAQSSFFRAWVSSHHSMGSGGGEAFVTGLGPPAWGLRLMIRSMRMRTSCISVTMRDSAWVTSSFSKLTTRAQAQS